MRRPASESGYRAVPVTKRARGPRRRRTGNHATATDEVTRGIGPQVTGCGTSACSTRMARSSRRPPCPRPGRGPVADASGCASRSRRAPTLSHHGAAAQHSPFKTSWPEVAGCPGAPTDRQELPAAPTRATPAAQRATSAQQSRVGIKKPRAIRPGVRRPRQQPTFSLSQYHRRALLDDRVRDGNGYGQSSMTTGNSGPLQQNRSVGRKVSLSIRL